MDWERIWLDHWKDVYTYIYYKVSSRQEAEDVTQETFIRVIKSGKVYEQSVIGGVLKKTAYHLIIDRWRQSRKEKGTVPIGDYDAGDGGLNDPEKRFLHDETVRRALDVLTDDQRDIVRLRLIQGYSVKETAEITGKSESAVKTAQFRAVKLIQQALGPSPIQGVNA